MVDYLQWIDEMRTTVNVTFKTARGEIFVVAAPVGITLMQAAVKNNVPGIEAECGGSCICATCHVYCDDVAPAVLGEAGQQERDMLEMTASERRASSRLSCQIKLTAAVDGAVVTIPEAQY